MRVIVDTNVFVAAIFWPGYPRKVVDACMDNRTQLVVTSEIFQEYERITMALAKRYESQAWKEFLELVLSNSEIHVSTKLLEKVSRDPKDDMFIECAVSAKVKVIVSGDNDLLAVSGYKGVEIINPAEFVKKYLKSSF